MIATTQTESGARKRGEMRAVLDLAAREVFRVMVGTELERGEEPRRREGADLTAMVGLAGDPCGMLSVRCGQKSAERIAGLMLDLAPENAAEHAWDAMGEVANMIAGNYKNKVNGKADQCMLSLPSVVTGSDYSFHSLTASGGIVLWFEFERIALGVRLELHGEE